MNIPTDFKLASAVVNLRQRFGQRYQIEYDPAYYAEHGRRSRVDVPELQIVSCQHGHVFPWGGTRLAASTDSRGATAGKLVALACCRVEQDGDDGVTVSFDVEDFRVVANIIKPRGRRRLDPQRRQAFVDCGRAHRYGVRTG